MKGRWELEYTYYTNNSHQKKSQQSEDTWKMGACIQLSCGAESLLNSACFVVRLVTIVDKDPGPHEWLEIKDVMLFSLHALSGRCMTGSPKNIPLTRSSSSLSFTLTSSGCSCRDNWWYRALSLTICPSKKANSSS